VFVALMDVLAWLFVIGLGILALMFAGAGLGALIGTLLVGLRKFIKWPREAIRALPISGTIAWYGKNGWRAWVFTAIVAWFVLFPLFAEMNR
jgi:hypothetical protein